MYFFNNLIFDIKKNNYAEIKELNHCMDYSDIFLKTYTTLTENEINKLEPEAIEELVIFVHEQLDITKSDLFMKMTKKFINKYNNNITYFMISILTNKGYKASEMLQWDLDTLFNTFYLEIALSDNILNFINATSSYFSEDIKNQLLKMFNKEQSVQENEQERMELINQLNSI